MNFKLLFACAFMISLGACNTPTVSNITPVAVQATAKSICAWVEPISSVANMISAAPILTTAESIANAICNAATTAPLADGPNANYKPQVYGVTLKGKFQ